MSSIPAIRASGADIDAPVPTRRTVFFRTFPVWQLFRFVIINLRMVRMIRLSHPHKVPPSTSRRPSEAPTDTR